MRGPFVVIMVSLVALAPSQSLLSLDDALKLAKERNGSVRAAVKNLEAARSGERQARAAFYPTVRPTLDYSDQRVEQNTGLGGGNNFFGPAQRTTINSETTTAIVASWQLLDSGQRDFAFRGARRGTEAQTLTALQTLRQTLFTVHTRYFDAIRARELVKVQDAQVERSRRVVRQIEAQIREGEAAEKDVLQPKADELNAVVNQLSAQTRLVNNEANLKASIGWEREQVLPALEMFDEPATFPEMEPLDRLVQEGLENRSDLGAQRKNVERQRFSSRLVQAQNGLSVSLDLTYTKQFGMDNLNNRLLRFTASYPLFDADRAKEAVREARLGVQAAEESLTQAERDAVAEIEAAWREADLNSRRIQAAKLARDAARVNFERVLRSNELGAANVTVVDISQAQLTLVTAETNYIEAVFDWYIAQVRLRLAVGRPIPGEDS